MTNAPTRSGFSDGVLCGMLLMVGSSAIHWFITPMSHPDASTAREVGAAIQGLLGFGGAAALFLRARWAARRPTHAAADVGHA
jgi:hypothetical protein